MSLRERQCLFGRDNVYSGETMCLREAAASHHASQRVQCLAHWTFIATAKRTHLQFATRCHIDDEQASQRRTHNFHAAMT